jgi:hypothetical protein
MLQVLSLLVQLADHLPSTSPEVDGISNAIDIHILSGGTSLPMSSSCSVSDPFTFDIPLGPAARQRLRRCKCLPRKAPRLRFASCTRLRSTRSNPKLEEEQATGYLPSCCGMAISSLRLPWHLPVTQHLFLHEDAGCCRDTALSFPHCSLNNRKQGGVP